jgi:hypothetical protein
MRTTNRVAAYFQDVPVIEYEEACDMERSAWEEGWSEGFDQGFYLWIAAGIAGLVVGFIAGRLI